MLHGVRVTGMAIKSRCFDCNKENGWWMLDFIRSFRHYWSIKMHLL